MKNPDFAAPHVPSLVPIWLHLHIAVGVPRAAFADQGSSEMQLDFVFSRLIVKLSCT